MIINSSLAAGFVSPSIYNRIKRALLIMICDHLGYLVARSLDRLSTMLHRNSNIPDERQPVVLVS